jgi:hypothetical protein
MTWLLFEMWNEFLEAPVFYFVPPWPFPSLTTSIGYHQSLSKRRFGFCVKWKINTAYVCRECFSTLIWRLGRKWKFPNLLDTNIESPIRTWWAMCCRQKSNNLQGNIESSQTLFTVILTTPDWLLLIAKREESVTDWRARADTFFRKYG